MRRLRASLRPTRTTYTEATPTFAPGPSPITAVPESPVASVPAAVPSPPTPPAPPTVTLAAPVFSIQGGTYPITDFDLSLVIRNPNPAGSSDLFYRIDFGPWNPYGGTLTIPPSSRVEAQAVSQNATYNNDSGITSATYKSSGVILDPPAILPDQPSFGLFSASGVIVELLDPNRPGDALLQYRVEGSPWMDYTTPFALEEGLYPPGATIEARAVSAGSPYLLPQPRAPAMPPPRLPTPRSRPRPTPPRISATESTRRRNWHTCSPLRPPSRPRPRPQSPRRPRFGREPSPTKRYRSTQVIPALARPSSPPTMLRLSPPPPVLPPMPPAPPQ